MLPICHNLLLGIKEDTVEALSGDNCPMEGLTKGKFTGLEIRASNQSLTQQKYCMTHSNFPQSIIHILNLMTQLNNVSLCYENIHIFSQNPHYLFQNSFGKAF